MDSKSMLVTATRYIQHGCDLRLSSDEAGDGLVENRHAGWVVLADLHAGLFHCTPGAQSLTTFFRSAAKPFQAAPLLSEEGFYADLSPSELALCCASHTGSPMHLTLARSILAKADLTETALQCGAHEPLDAESRQALSRTGQLPTPIHNNCSGKHAGMLFYCRRAGLDPSRYLDPLHPLQQKILSMLQTWSSLSDIPVGMDGCGAPVFYMPLRAMAKLYARLGADNFFTPLAQAMTTQPVIVGGAGRVDTVLMQASQGQLLAKVGADGVICVSRVGTGQGLALKIADGANAVRDLAIVEILLRLGWLDPDARQDNRVQPYLQTARMNTQDKAVGRYCIHFEPEALQAFEF